MSLCRLINWGWNFLRRTERKMKFSISRGVIKLFFSSIFLLTVQSDGRLRVKQTLQRGPYKERESNHNNYMREGKKKATSTAVNLNLQYKFYNK